MDQEAKVGDIVVTTKDKKWSSTSLVMRRAGNRWTAGEGELQAGNCRNRSTQRSRRRDEIKTLAGVGWSEDHRKGLYLAADCCIPAVLGSN